MPKPIPTANTLSLAAPLPEAVPTHLAAPLPLPLTTQVKNNTAQGGGAAEQMSISEMYRELDQHFTLTKDDGEAVDEAYFLSTVNSLRPKGGPDRDFVGVVLAAYYCMLPGRRAYGRKENMEDTSQVRFLKQKGYTLVELVAIIESYFKSDYFRKRPTLRDLYEIIKKGQPWPPPKAEAGSHGAYVSALYGLGKNDPVPPTLEEAMNSEDMWKHYLAFTGVPPEHEEYHRQQLGKLFASEMYSHYRHYLEYWKSKNSKVARR
jgi:hypothetical protein